MMTSHILSLVFFVLFFCFRLVYRMFGLPSWWFFLLCFPLLLEGQSGERPQLTNSRVLPLQGMVASERYEYLLTTLEFDQDVYVNDAFLCPGQDRDCVKSDCVPCDWSGEEVVVFFHSVAHFVPFSNFFPPSLPIASTQIVVDLHNTPNFLPRITSMTGVIPLSPLTKNSNSGLKQMNLL